MRGMARLVLVGILGGGCGAEGPTGVILEVRSELSIPAEIEEVLVRVRDARGRRILEKWFPLSGPGAVALPGRIGFEPAEPPDGPLEIDVVGRHQSRPVIIKTARLTLARHEVRQVELHLERACLGLLCPQGRTCMAGGRCGSPVLPHKPDPDGPACNCFSLFPICVGARWAYDELRNGNRIPYKQWSFASFGPIQDPLHEKQEVQAFLQVRPSELDFSHKWVSARQRPHRVFYWEKEDQFNKDLEPRVTTYFVDRKIRLNEGLLPGRPEVERYVQFDYDHQLNVQVKIENEDTWDVVPVEEVRNLPSSAFPERFARARVVCHRRTGRPVEVTPPERSMDYQETEKIFCFVAGVGKVYERTLRPRPEENRQEVLVDYRIPGNCPPPPELR